jgi:hypothetical protein
MKFMKYKISYVVGLGALALMVALNLRHAHNNYGILDSNLPLQVLAQTNSSGSGSGGSSGNGGSSSNNGGGTSGNGDDSSGDGTTGNNNKYKTTSPKCTLFYYKKIGFIGSYVFIDNVPDNIKPPTYTFEKSVEGYKVVCGEGTTPTCITVDCRKDPLAD